jgi:hypothetical protein
MSKISAVDDHTASLASSKDDQFFENLKNLILRVNKYVESQGYAIIWLRTKKLKLGITRETWFICDRDRKITESKEQERRHCTSRQIECFFSLTAKKQRKIWFLEVINSTHNHFFSLAKAHSILKRMTMIAEIKSDICRQFTVQTFTFKILFSLRIFDSIDIEKNAFADAIASSDTDLINSMFSTRDIYNFKTQLRRDALDSLTSVQILIREFDERDWMFQLQKNVEDQITHLFFSKDSCQSILKNNYEVLIMNCIYKTSKYKMSLMIINDQIAMHINFYVDFCFMNKKTMTNYCWILSQLKALYAQLESSDSTVIVIDMKRELMHVIAKKLSETNHLLCI